MPPFPTSNISGSARTVQIKKEEFRTSYKGGALIYMSLLKLILIYQTFLPFHPPGPA